MGKATGIGSDSGIVGGSRGEIKIGREVQTGRMGGKEKLSQGKVTC